MIARRVRRGRALLALLAFAPLAVVSCRSRGATETPSASLAPPAPAVPSAPASTGPRIVALGDSLTAGLGLAPEEAYPALLQKRLDAAGYRFEVVNAGVSGETSAGGLRRLDWALQGDVRILILALGANDGLRGVPVDEMTRNLSQIVEQAERRRIAVLLAGMEALPNYGPTYALAFHQAFPDLARTYHVAFLPFLLRGVAGNPGLNQPDGLHPTAAGARMVADNVWAALRPILGAASIQ